MPKKGRVNGHASSDRRAGVPGRRGSDAPGESDPALVDGHLSANPHAPIDRERTGPLRPPRPPIGLPILPDANYVFLSLHHLYDFTDVTTQVRSLLEATSG